MPWFTPLLDALNLRRALASRDPGTETLRREVEAALQSENASLAGALIARIDERGDRDEWELETERLTGLVEGADALKRLDTEGLPVVVSQHKAIGADTCHFTVPATLVVGGDEQPGRVFVTAERVIFSGGRGASLRWSEVAGADVELRTLLLARAAGSVHRIRCNTCGQARVLQVFCRRLMCARPRWAVDQ